MIDGIGSPGLAVSVDTAALLQHGHVPLADLQALGPLIAHAYAINPASVATLALRGSFAHGALDWEEYLGALEEVNYRGYLTIRADPSQPPGPQFSAVAKRLAAL